MYFEKLLKAMDSDGNFSAFNVSTSTPQGVSTADYDVTKGTVVKIVYLGEDSGERETISPAQFIEKGRKTGFRRKTIIEDLFLDRISHMRVDLRVNSSE